MTLEKKTLETLYLTVEQVRVAASAWLTAHALPSSARKVIYEKAARIITYRQRKNRDARICHTRKTLQSLKNKGIKIKQLKFCAPPDLEIHVAL